MLISVSPRGSSEFSVTLNCLRHRLRLSFAERNPFIQALQNVTVSAEDGLLASSNFETCRFHHTLVSLMSSSALFTKDCAMSSRITYCCSSSSSNEMTVFKTGSIAAPYTICIALILANIFRRHVINRVRNTVTASRDNGP